MLTALCSIVLLLADIAPPADLNGKVVDSENKPIVSATAIIYSAVPKKGEPTQNPSDYPDCTHTVTSDAEGKFTFAGVDSSLRFDVFVTADGFRPNLLRKVDPARGEMKAKLTVVPATIEADHMLRGHVVDNDGNAVVGAKVEVFGEKNETQRWWGRVEDAETQAYTDGKGEFVIICKKPDLQLDLKITARHLAPELCPLVSTGLQVYETSLGKGASVTGRLMKDGSPVAGVRMMVSQQNRNVETYLGDFSAYTDDAGKFTFTGLHPNDNYYLYGSIKSLAALGALSIKSCSVTGDDTIVDAGDLTVEPAYTLSGQLVASDGKEIPVGTKVTLSREDAWETIDVPTTADGKFEFKGLPSETYTFYVDLKGYHISHDNQSFEPMNAAFLMGTVDGDVTDLKVQLDPGPREQPSQNGSAWQRLRTTRLTGIAP